jgi:tRNA(fMet)-specific endonuclease VapC
MFTLDTNTLIYFFKGIGNVGPKLLAVSPQEVAIPSVVLYEIETGIAKMSQPDKRQHALKALLHSVRVIPFDQASAKVASEIRVHLEKLGAPIGPLDVLIAATALAHGAILVTHNTQEFSRVPHLRIEDWH